MPKAMPKNIMIKKKPSEPKEKHSEPKEKLIEPKRKKRKEEKGSQGYGNLSPKPYTPYPKPRNP